MHWIIIPKLFIVLFLCKSSLTCHTFNDTLVEIEIDKGGKVNRTVTGCIERKSYPDLVIKGLYFWQQNIPTLGKDAVRHFSKLRTLTFYGCGIKRIEERPFRNLPRIDQMAINYNPLREIPNYVFDGLNLNRLRLENNNIDIISDRAFVNMSKLLSFHCSNNKIDYYGREWFLNSTDLKIIDFQFNKLRIVPRRAFYYNQKLQEIYFDYNDIDTIQEDAFEGLTSLKYLGLSYNRIKKLNDRVFPLNMKIRSLLLDANKLNYIPYSLLEKISVEDLTISGNPWKCPCLERIQYWVFERKGTIRASPQCVHETVPICSNPQVFSRTCLETYDQESTEYYFKQVLPLKDKLSEFCVRFD